MNKCPKCNKEVNHNAKYCPHCGAKLIQDAKRENTHENERELPIRGINLLIILAFFVIPLLFSELYSDNTTSSSNSVLTLSEVTDSSYTGVVYTYNDLDTFAAQVTPTDEYVEIINDYKNEMIELLNLEVTSMIYNIEIYNNYEVSFDIDYIFTIDDDYTLTINRYFTRSDEEGTTSYTITQRGIESLSDIVINEIIYTFVEDSEIETVYNDLLDRSDEFETAKESLGHYGFGEYGDKASIVVYPDDEGYKVKLKYKES